MESERGDRRELPERLPSDPNAAVAETLVNELRAGGCYASYETAQHVTYVWFDAGQFKAEVWTNGQPQEIVQADSLAEARENVEFFYGATDD